MHDNSNIPTFVLQYAGLLVYFSTGGDNSDFGSQGVSTDSVLEAEYADPLFVGQVRHVLSLQRPLFRGC